MGYYKLQFYDTMVKMPATFQSNLQYNNFFTKDQKKHILATIKEEAKELRKHFRNDGWDLDESCIIDRLLYDIFGMNLIEEIAGELAFKTKTARLLGERNKIANKVEKVICTPRGRLYIDTQPKSTNDTILGNL